MNTANRYFYLPIAFYSGMVLKCAGIANATNRDWFTAQYPKPSNWMPTMATEFALMIGPK